MRNARALWAALDDKKMRIPVLTIALLLPHISAAQVEVRPIGFQIYVPHERFSSAMDGLDQEIFKAINSKSDWKQLWREIEPRLSRDESMRQPFPLPRIDFSRYTLIVVALGDRPSSGYGVSIYSVSEDQFHVDVSAFELRPDTDCVVLAVLTHPIALVLIPRTDKEVRVHVRKGDVPCGE